MDQAIEAKEAPLTTAMAAAFLRQTKELLVATETGAGFAKHYFDALQRDPDVVLAHGAVARFFNGRPPPPKI